MAIARCQQIDASVTRWYHCMTRCVRRAFLLDEGKSNRKEWLENRIEELAEIFAVGVGGFSVMCKKQPDAWACDGSQIWRDARPVDAALSRESHRALGRSCPLFPRATDPILCRFSPDFAPARILPRAFAGHFSLSSTPATCSCSDGALRQAAFTLATESQSTKGGFSLAVNLTRATESPGGTVSRADSPTAGPGRG